MDFTVPATHNLQDLSKGIVKFEDNAPFLTLALGNPSGMHYRSRHSHAQVIVSRTYNIGPYPTPGASLAVQTVHGAFAEHLSLELSPEVLWYIIVNEIATHVKLNPQDYKGFFQGDPNNPETIVICDDSLIYGSQENQWGLTISLFYPEMVKLLGKNNVDLFVPRFSTSTSESDIALLVAFMDAASPYYRYEVRTLCGIPQIRLAGEIEDWMQLTESTRQLQSVFGGLNGYFTDLLPVLDTIAETAMGISPDPSFWRSIYKYEDGSGGASITGWLQSFFAHTHHKGSTQLKAVFNWKSTKWDDKSKPNSFPSHITKVPFVWKYYDQQINMLFAAGIFGADWENDFLAPRLGFGVFEV